MALAFSRAFFGVFFLAALGSLCTTAAAQGSRRFKIGTELCKIRKHNCPPVGLTSEIFGKTTAPDLELNICRA